jgi:hypothetical protein
MVLFFLAGGAGVADGCTAGGVTFAGGGGRDGCEDGGLGATVPPKSIGRDGRELII